MSKKSKAAKRKKLEDIEGKFDLGNACCSGDCTGLIQVGLTTDEELESYCEIFNFEPPNLNK